MTTWNNVEIFKFLEVYRTEPAIWNPKDLSHKDKTKVNDAWKRISDALNIPIVELKKKKETLMTSFRSHLRKKKESMKNARSEEVYKPVWVFYEIMESFLMDVYENKNLAATKELQCVAVNGDVEGYVNGGACQQAEHILTDGQENVRGHIAVFPFQSDPPKIPEELIDAKASMNAMNAVNAVSTVNALITKEDDECDLYGRLIAKKLRQFDTIDRDELMLEIDRMILKKRKEDREFIYRGRNMIFTSRISSGD